MSCQGDKKKRKKRLKEQKKAARQQRIALEKFRESEYPRILIDPTRGIPPFVTAVREVISRFSFTDDSCCPERLRNSFGIVAEVGARGLYDFVTGMVAAFHPDQDDDFRLWRVQEVVVPVWTHLGEWIFDRLPSRFTDKFDPEHAFFVDLGGRGNTIVIRFGVMDRIQDSGHSLFIPPTKPSVSIHGADWRIGLHNHALQRLCERLIPAGSLTYRGRLDLHFRLTQNRIRYVPITLPDGGEAIRVDFEAPIGTYFYASLAKFARTVLGLPEDHRFTEDAWTIVLGYMPLWIRGRYARAVTFLLPGFRNTPEHQLLRTRASDFRAKEILRVLADETRIPLALSQENAEATKWYQDNGVPQISKTVA